MLSERQCPPLSNAFKCLAGHTRVQGNTNWRIKMRFCLVVATLLLLSCSTHGFFWPSKDDDHNRMKQAGSPLVFLPGTGASQLEAKIDRTEVAFPHCPKKVPWNRVWLDVWQLLAGDMDCWSDNIKLIYDPKTGKSRNTPGVETRVPGWGVTATVEYLDPSWAARTLGIARYAAPFVERLVSWGYERGESVVAAPYDWRYAPHSQEEYFKNLRKLIEDTYTVNYNKRVTLFAHSLGSLFGLYFLNGQSQEWKDKYIHSFVTTGAPWEGSAIEFQLFASGMNFGIPTVDPSVIRHEQRTQENNMLMLPKPGAEWTSRDAFVFTPKRNYTVYDVEDFMKDVDFSVGNDMYKYYLDPAYALKHPGVPFHCITSKGHPTEAQFVYDKEFDQQKFPKTLYSDGDGTVNLRSLRGCQRMQVPGNFSYHEIDGATHMKILGREELFALLYPILYK